MAVERDFQAALIKELKKRLPGCIVLKNDSSYIQGIPDLTVLWKHLWAVLECKKDGKASRRPNQVYYVDKMNEMGFASFIWPEVKDAVLNRLEGYMKDG